MRNRKKLAFTLIELLIVVIVLGVLAGVAVPKFKRVLETRKTTEAENMLAAVRTEQEKRCIIGKKYQTDNTKVEALANAQTSKNYTYTLTSSGITAESKGSSNSYSIKMISYKEGDLCCEGKGCSTLNKNYPTCPALVYRDECSGSLTCDGEKPEESSITREEDGCTNTYIQKMVCDTDYGVWTVGELVLKDSQCGGAEELDCSENPNQSKCCTETQYWSNESKKCLEKQKCDPTKCRLGKIYNPKTCNCRTCTEEEQIKFPAQCCGFKMTDRGGQWWNPLTKTCKIKVCPEGETAFKTTVGGTEQVGCCKNATYTRVNSAGQTVHAYSYWTGKKCVTGLCKPGETILKSCLQRLGICIYKCKGSGGGDPGNHNGNEWSSNDDDSETDGPCDLGLIECDGEDNDTNTDDPYWIGDDPWFQDDDDDGWESYDGTW